MNEKWSIWKPITDSDELPIITYLKGLIRDKDALLLSFETKQQGRPHFKIPVFIPFVVVTRPLSKIFLGKRGVKSIKRCVATQIVTAIILSFVLACIWPFIALLSGFIFIVGKPLEEAGLISLNVEGTSFISVVLFIFLMVFIAGITFKFAKRKTFVLTLPLISIVFSSIVYVLTSSLLSV